MTTVWSVVRRAGQGDTEAQAILYRMYVYPIYSYLRRRECPPEDAEDLVHQLFHKLLDSNEFSKVDAQKGRLRTWLLTCAGRLLLDEWKKESAQKRGGGLPTISWDAVDAENRFRLEPSDPRNPEHHYDRTWAEAVLQRAMDRLRGEFEGGAKGERFDLLRGLLLGDSDLTSYAEAAKRLGVSEQAIKGAMFRLRTRLRELLREEIKLTVDSEEELEDEMRYLQRVLQG